MMGGWVYSFTGRVPAQKNLGSRTCSVVMPSTEKRKKPGVPGQLMQQWTLS